MHLYQSRRSSLANSGNEESFSMLHWKRIAKHILRTVGFNAEGGVWEWKPCDFLDLSFKERFPSHAKMRIVVATSHTLCTLYCVYVVNKNQKSLFSNLKLSFLQSRRDEMAQNRKVTTHRGRLNQGSVFTDFHATVAFYGKVETDENSNEF